MKRVLVSGEYPFLADRLKGYGFTPIAAEADDRLPKPIRFHPDMQACPLKETLFVLRKNNLYERLRELHIKTLETQNLPGHVYPKDVLCNGFVLGEYFVANPKSIDAAILTAAQKEKLRLLPIRQGYASCAAAVIDEHSVITADPGVASALAAADADVLRIRPGGISLPGYDTGFIGGCCGLIQPGVVAFSGSLKSHPEGQAIGAFLKERHVIALELQSGPLLDVGGFICLEPFSE